MLLAALLIAAQALPDAPPAPDTAFDIRCLLAGGLLIGAEDEEVRAAAPLFTMFYLGRVDARIPDHELESNLRREIAALDEEQLDSLLVACGEYMETRGNRLQDMGGRLESPFSQEIR